MRALFAFAVYADALNLRRSFSALPFQRAEKLRTAGIRNFSGTQAK